MKTIHVVAAVIRDGEGRIFATQRGYGPYNETPEEALKREIREELDAEIEVGEPAGRIEYDYPEFHLSMDCFFCVLLSGTLTLKEHEAAKWLRPEELDSVAWLPADLSLIERLKA